MRRLGIHYPHWTLEVWVPCGDGVAWRLLDSRNCTTGDNAKAWAKGHTRTEVFAAMRFVIKRDGKTWATCGWERSGCWRLTWKYDESVAPPDQRQAREEGR